MDVLRLFTAHPRSVGETYGEHMGVACGFSLRLLAGAIACVVHAFLPFLFARTASGIISELHQRMVVSRDRKGSLSRS